MTRVFRNSHSCGIWLAERRREWRRTAGNNDCTVESCCLGCTITAETRVAHMDSIGPSQSRVKNTCKIKFEGLGCNNHEA